MTEAPVARLRGHHLVCLHFYRGEGYDASFLDNLADVLARLAADPGVVVAGADDVCSACPGLHGDHCRHAPGMEAEVHRLDALASRLLGVTPGDAIDFAALRDRLPAVLDAWIAEACTDCEWRRVCRPRMDAHPNQC
jgi:hypothetical protein